MAGAVVLSSFLQTLMEKLANAALNEWRSVWSVNTDVTSLSSTLSTIQTLLEDAEEKQATDGLIRIWLIKLKDVAYDIDDLLEKYAANALQSKSKDQSRSQWREKVVNYFSCYCSQKPLFRYQVAQEIKEIKERLDTIARERDSFGLRNIGEISRLDVAQRPQSSSLIDDLCVLGRDEDRENIVKFLLDVNTSSRFNVAVVPIIGMGGLGKTTLSKLVYNDERIKEHFELRMWVCVSENFDEIKLTKETLESTVTGLSMATTNMNLLQDNLCEKLKGKRFLLVLDDVWNEDHDKWHRFRSTLIVGEKGSKIVVTTRNENVGRIMGGLPPYRLKQLSDDDCWKLFKNYAFVNGESSGHPKLEEIGMEIVKKLKGLPLAAKALGSLLYSKLDEDDWKDILRNEIWELPPDKNNILPALRLSYKHLPPYLKQCFAFCSVFHKDYVFQKDKLVQIWMALGFIQSHGRKRIEDIGKSYFDDLVNRSFFQPYKGKYVMHDAIHDLAQSISTEETLRLEDGVQRKDLTRFRHLSFSCDNSARTSFERFYEFKKLRTLLLLRGFKSPTDVIPSDLFEKLKYIRVLDLYRRDIDVLPESIGNLKHLRYLGLSYTGIKTLPLSISKLHALEMLKLTGCNELNDLPRGLTNLINLRHLEASTQLLSGIANIGRLSSLQELEEFVIRKDQSYSIRELKNMRELRGRLTIKNLENVETGKDASEAKMETKEYLTALELLWTQIRLVGSIDECIDDEVLEGLRPHHELKELSIEGYPGFRFPNWLGSISFSNLQTININNIRNCRFLPSVGQLPFLRYLVIIGIFSVTHIAQEFSGTGVIKGFQSLNELVIEDMPNLEEWVNLDEDRLFPCLTDLEIVECPKLRCLPQLPPTLKRLKISEAGIGYLPQVWFDARPSSLSSLNIYDCPNLKSLQQGLLSQQLSSLEKVTIANCKELMTLPHECFQPFVSLKCLHIYNCPRFVIESQESVLLPTTVEDIQVGNCSSGFVNGLLNGLGNLTCLRHLRISECSDLYHFPEGVQPATLKFLGISDCINIRSLPAWLQNLSSLSTLAIINCPKIQFFPERGLPAMLRELYIKECKMLKKQYVENEREEWPLISHVADIVVHEDWINRNVGRRVAESEEAMRTDIGACTSYSRGFRFESCKRHL